MSEREYRPRHLAPDSDEPQDYYREPTDRHPAARHRRAAPEGGRRSTAETDSLLPARVDRFVGKHGWRAYALPALTVLAVLAIIGAMVRTPPETVYAASAVTPNAAPSASPSAAPSSAPSATSSAVAPTPDGEGESAPPITAGPTASFVEAGDGTLNVVPGDGAVLGTGGDILTFDVEIEGGIGVDGAQFALRVEQILGDSRSWGAGGQQRFQRIGSGTPDFHVALVSPQHVESLCPGYGTNGYTSCRYKDRAVINLARWSVGVDDYAGQLETYREYVINHEVGHYLGHTHVGCTGPGRKAPVMMQQTLGIGDCTINAWPYPNGPADDPEAPA